MSEGKFPVEEKTKVLPDGFWGEERATE